MNKLLLISYDAVGSDEVPELLKLPNFSRLVSEGSLFTEMRTVFVSNTYPIHSSVSTGTLPREHGLTANTKPFPENPHPEYADWNYDSRLLKRKTLWQAAHEKGLRTAAVLWPVTGCAKEIQWNIPESMAKWGENQLMVNLKTGSKLLQIVEFLKHGKLMNGIHQPELDRFSTECMRDIIRRRHPDLALLHLTAYDSICHEFGRGSAEAIAALGDLDRSLGRVLEVIDKKTIVIIFSDHAQLNVHSQLDLNTLLQPGKDAYFQDMDGVTMFRAGSLSPEEIETIQNKALAVEGVNRLLTPRELSESGFEGIAAFGLAAKEGWCFRSLAPEKATHGYPTDYPNYGTFMAVSEPWEKPQTDSILEVTKAAAQILELDMN